MKNKNFCYAVDTVKKKPVTVIDRGISVQRTRRGTRIIVLRELLRIAPKQRRDKSVEFVIGARDSVRLAKFIRMLHMVEDK